MLAPKGAGLRSQGLFHDWIYIVVRCGARRNFAAEMGAEMEGGRRGVAREEEGRNPQKCSQVLTVWPGIPKGSSESVRISI
jgi:hypothetical protein